MLQDILQEHVVDSLQKIGLDISGDAHATIEEVQSLLHSLEQHEIASSLRKLLDLGKLMGGIAILNNKLYIMVFLKKKTARPH